MTLLSINNQAIERTHFPDNTSQVWQLSEEFLAHSDLLVEWSFEHEAEFMALAQLKTLLDSRGIKARLHMDYLPYGRQDKDVRNDATFGLITFAQLLNSLAFVEVTIVDPHSERALELIANSRAIYPLAQLQALLEDGVDLLCYPDRGALNKYSKIYFHPFIYGDKQRDQKTGHILSYQLHGDPSGKHVLIVDDICDGGMTFKLLAKDLLAAGAKSVRLFVSHGIFSKGSRTLYASGISAIHTPAGPVGRRTYAASI